MASDFKAAALLSFSILGCGSEAPVRYPLHGPMLRDPDLVPVSLPCRSDGEKPGQVVCAPKEYRSSLWWDGVDQTIFRPVSRFFAVDAGGEASNVSSLEEVPDSTWFVNRIGVRPLGLREIAAGYCAETPHLPTDLANGSWVVDRGKGDGATPGFRVSVAGAGKFALKADDSFSPERASAAEAIVSRLYYAAGYNTPCYFVVHFRPALLKLKPGLTYRSNVGRIRPFDQAALDKLLSGLPRRGELVRMGASAWLPGRILGPFTYQGTREDNPRDVVPHEDRRDLRGARLMAAWVNHYDTREQNTMETWMARDPSNDGASPGIVRHWLLDFGDSLGFQWNDDEFSRRLGHSYYFDPQHVLADWFTFGIIERPWDRARSLDPMFPYFRDADFDPEEWVGGYPNPAFARMTEADGAWMARIIARFTPEQLRAVIATGDFTQHRHADLLHRILIARQRRILGRYLAKISPIGQLDVRNEELCGIDFARQTRVFDDARFRYAASARIVDDRASARPLRISIKAAGSFCIPLTGSGGPPRSRNGRPSYWVVKLTNGQALGELRAFLYDMGKERGFRLVGVERPEP
jgi:hypothetical protein